MNEYSFIIREGESVSRKNRKKVDNLYIKMVSGRKKGVVKGELRNEW